MGAAGATAGAVTQDVRAVLREWRAARLADAEAHGDQSLATERMVQAEAWAAWERSKADKERRRVVQGRGGAVATIRTEVTTETRPGNPDFLDAVGRSNQRVIDLLGLAGPVRVNLNGEAGADPEALASAEWLGGFIEAVGRVRYGDEEPAAALPARPGLLSLAPDDAAADLVNGLGSRRR